MLYCSYNLTLQVNVDYPRWALLANRQFFDKLLTIVFWKWESEIHKLANTNNRDKLINRYSRSRTNTALLHVQNGQHVQKQSYTKHQACKGENRTCSPTACSALSALVICFCPLLSRSGEASLFPRASAHPSEWERSRLRDTKCRKTLWRKHLVKSCIRSIDHDITCGAVILWAVVGRVLYAVIWWINGRIDFEDRISNCPDSFLKNPDSASICYICCNPCLHNIMEVIGHLRLWK